VEFHNSALVVVASGLLPVDRHRRQRYVLTDASQTSSAQRTDAEKRDSIRVRHAEQRLASILRYVRQASERIGASQPDSSHLRMCNSNLEHFLNRFRDERAR